jgi:transcriptional regulator with XRE-family HTH domain
MKTTFYERVLSRQRTDESLPEFGKRIGITFETLKSWAKGKRPTRADLYVRLAEILNCTPAWLAYGKEAEGPKINETTGGDSL